MKRLPLLLIIFGELMCTYANVSGNFKIETEKLAQLSKKENHRRYNNLPRRLRRRNMERIKNSLYFVPMEYVDGDFNKVQMSNFDPWNYYYFVRNSIANEKQTEHEYLKSSTPKHEHDPSKDFQIQTYNPSPLKTKYVITNFGEMVRNAENDGKLTIDESMVTPPIEIVPSTNTEDNNFLHKAHPIIEDLKDAREVKVKGAGHEVGDSNNNHISNPVAVYTVRPIPEDQFEIYDTTLRKPAVKATYHKLLPEISLYQPATTNNFDSYKAKIDRYSNEIKFRTSTARSITHSTTTKRPDKQPANSQFFANSQQGNATREESDDDVFFPTRKNWNYIPSSKGRQAEKIRYVDAPYLDVYSPKNSEEAAFMQNYYKKMQTERSGDVVITPTISEFLRMNNMDRTVENLVFTQTYPTRMKSSNRKVEGKYHKLFTARKASTPSSDFVYLKYKPFRQSSTRGTDVDKIMPSKDLLKDVDQECDTCTPPPVFTPCCKHLETTWPPCCTRPWCKTPCPKPTCSSCPGFFGDLEGSITKAQQVAEEVLRSQKMQDETNVAAPRQELVHKPKGAPSPSVADKQEILDLYQELHKVLSKIIAAENCSSDDSAAFTEHALNSRQLVDFMTDLVDMSNRIATSMNRLSEGANDLREEGEMSLETTRTRIHTLQNRLADEQARLAELNKKIREGHECRRLPPPTRKRKKFRLFPWKRE